MSASHPEPKFGTSACGHLTGEHYKAANPTDCPRRSIVRRGEWLARHSTSLGCPPLPVTLPLTRHRMAQGGSRGGQELLAVGHPSPIRALGI